MGLLIYVPWAKITVRCRGTLNSLVLPVALAPDLGAHRLIQEN